MDCAGGASLAPLSLDWDGDGAEAAAEGLLDWVGFWGLAPTTPFPKSRSLEEPWVFRGLCGAVAPRDERLFWGLAGRSPLDGGPLGCLERGVFWGLETGEGRPLEVC